MSGHQYLKFHRSRGQAATELAVFGAILVFLIGAIVRTSVSSSYQQNQQLKAMRYALLQSYKTTMAGAAGRNSASVLYIEDRLSPDLLRYGPSDRSPSIAQGSGTLSKMLMYPLDIEDLVQSKHLPVMDVYINGKHFEFTTAGFTQNKLLLPPKETRDDYYKTWYSAATVPDPKGIGTYRYKGWAFKCIGPAKGPDPSNNMVDGFYGCPIFYQVSITPNADFGILVAEEAYDLNRNDDYTDDPGEGKAGFDDDAIKERKRMAWHWKGILGIPGNVKIDAENSTYPSFDVDNDKQEETIYAVGTSQIRAEDDPDVGSAANAVAVINSVTVFDFQDGDLDLSQDVLTNGRQPGLQNDMAIYTKTEDGTYLQIKEGRLYNPETQKFVRSASRRNQGEIIQRMFQLSNDTGRMCLNGNPVYPVELCGDCFLGERVKSTCYDSGRKLLFVRSRILDKSGVKWRTNVEGGL